MADPKKSTPKKKKKYTPEARAAALADVLTNGHTIPEAAKTHGINPHTLGAWVADARAKQKTGSTGLWKELNAKRSEAAIEARVQERMGEAYLELERHRRRARIFLDGVDLLQRVVNEILIPR